MRTKFFQKDKNDLIWLLKIFILWRIWLFFLAWLGVKLLPFKYSFPYVEHILKPYGSELFWSWANFDGVHYLLIAQNGYFAQGTQAFFPLYPLLVKYLSLIFKNLLATGLLISHLSFFLALLIFYKLLLADYSKAVAKSTVVFLLLFPTSFFFASFYTESLFFLMLVSCYYLLKQKKFFKAASVAFFAALTKLTGVFLSVVLFFHLYESYKNRLAIKKKMLFKKIVFSFLPLAGLAIYMFYLAENYGDPLYFIHAQADWGASRSVDRIILLYQVFYRYIKMIFTPNLDKFFYFTLILEFLSALMFLILLVFAYLRKIRLSYLLFAVPVYFLPTLTGTFSSMPRYVLMLFPCFIVLGMIKRDWIKKVIYLIFFILLSFFTILFSRGYWVA